MSHQIIVKNCNQSAEWYLAFLVGLGSYVNVKIVGALSVSEIFFCILGPYYLWTRWSDIKQSKLFPFLLLAIGWVLSALLTDIYRQTDSVNLLKGSASVILWFLDMVSLYGILSKNLSLIKPFCVGAAISIAFSTFVFGSGLFDNAQNADVLGDLGMTFKSHYVHIIIAWLLVLLLFSYPRKVTLCFIAFVVFSLMCFAFNSRANGGIALLAAGMLLFFRLNGGRPLRGWGILGLFVFMTVLLVGVSTSYKYVTLRGWLGEAQKEKYEFQSKSKVGILGGRAEFASALLAIKDSPILGHGSWAKDVNGYRLKGADLLGVEIHSTIINAHKEMLIPAHSHIWGPWVSHGLIGGMFWFCAFGFMLRFFVKHAQAQPEYLAFSIAILCWFYWDIWFSPFGFRPVNAAKFVFLLLIADGSNRHRLPPQQKSSVTTPARSRTRTNARHPRNRQRGLLLGR